MVLYTVVNIPYCALGGVITSDSQERVSANSYRFFIATSAGVLISFFGPGLVDRFGDGNQQTGLSLCHGGLRDSGNLCLLRMFFSLTKERVKQVSPTKGSFALDFKTLLKNDQWLIVAALFVLLIPIVLRGASQVYYAKWFMDKPELIAAFLTTGTFCQMVGAGFASSLTRKLGKVPAYALVQAIIVIGSIALYFVSNSNAWVIFVLFGLINFFVQMGAPSSLPWRPTQWSTVN